MRSASRAQSTLRPADAHSPSEVRFAPFRFPTPPAKASLGPLLENILGRLGSGSRGYTVRASMYRAQREIPQNMRYKTIAHFSSVASVTTLKPRRTGTSRSTLSYQGQLEERPGRLRKPHPVAPGLRLAQSFALCEDSPEGPAHQRRWPDWLAGFSRLLGSNIEKIR
jgi:hypothetical protein